MVGDPCLRTNQIEQLKQTTQWYNAERALRDSIDRILELENQDEQESIEEKERLTPSTFWTIMFCMVAELVLIVLLTIKIIIEFQKTPEKGEKISS